MRINLMMAAVAAFALNALPVAAQDRGDQGYDHSGDRGYNNGDRHYNDRNHTYYGRRNQNCRRSNGTTGTIAGAVGGGVIGNVVGGGTLGTLAGAGGGALLGRTLDKNHDRAQNRRNGC